MAQLADSDPTPDQREAPAQNATPPYIAIHNGQSTINSTTPIHELPRVSLVDIDQTGGITISYMAPDKITGLESGTAIEQYLKKNPTLELPTHNFC